MTEPQLYRDLSTWYRLLTPKEEYEDEAEMYRAIFARAVPGASTLLELGAGAGHNAFHLKAHYECTLTDLSESMLALSRDLNPDCEHALGDMRTLRLDRVFDLVLIHDAVMYMRTRSDLRAAVETALSHLRPGGAALFVPDYVKETFVGGRQVFEREEPGRSMVCVEWDWDPDPEDDTFIGDYVFVLQEGGGEVRVVRDRHEVSCFPRRVWMDTLRAVGFEPELLIQANAAPYDAQEVFLGVKGG